MSHFISPRMNLAHHGKPLDHFGNSVLKEVKSQWLNQRNCSAKIEFEAIKHMERLACK